MSNTITVHRLDQAKAATDQCVHFGFCTAVCPTYVLDAEENDSPRGRIAIAKDMLESGAPPSAAAVKHLDRCLSCLSCETTCAAGVKYRDIIDTAKEYIENSGVRPVQERLFRALLSRLLTTPSYLSFMMRAGRPLSRLGRRLPGSLGALASISNAPALRAFEPRTGLSAATHVVPTRRMALLSGCVQSVTGSEINASAQRVLERAGITVIPTQGSTCCGALDLHMGRRQRAIEHAAKTVKTWATQLECGEIEAIVVTTSGCASVIKHYDELLDLQPDLAPLVKRVMDATRDITEVLQELPMVGGDAVRGAVVSYHDACSMKHGLKLTRTPRNVLERLAFDVRDIAESHICCGSAGTYNILQPAIAERLGKRKAGHAESCRPDVIVAGNLGCLVQMSRFTNVPVAHTVQLVDWATGGPAPRGLENFIPKAPEESIAVAESLQPATISTEDSLW